jgi:hypothetical protein
MVGVCQVWLHLQLSFLSMSGLEGKNQCLKCCGSVLELLSYIPESSNKKIHYNLSITQSCLNIVKTPI